MPKTGVNVSDDDTTFYDGSDQPNAAEVKHKQTKSTLSVSVLISSFVAPISRCFTETHGIY